MTQFETIFLINTNWCTCTCTCISGWFIRFVKNVYLVFHLLSHIGVWYFYLCWFVFAMWQNLFKLFQNECDIYRRYLKNLWWRNYPAWEATSPVTESTPVCSPSIGFCASLSTTFQSRRIFTFGIHFSLKEAR